MRKGYYKYFIGMIIMALGFGVALYIQNIYYSIIAVVVAIIFDRIFMKKVVNPIGNPKIEWMLFSLISIIIHLIGYEYKQSIIMNEWALILVVLQIFFTIYLSRGGYAVYKYFKNTTKQVKN